MRIKLNESSKRTRSWGFTLAEVMVAVGVLGISFVSLYAAMSAGFAMTQVSRENLRATQIMLGKMEGIRLYNWNQITASNMIPATFVDHYYPGVGGEQPSGISYSGTIEVNKSTDANLIPRRSYDDDMRVVTVRVQWKSGNVVRSRMMSTMVSKHGLQNYVYDR